LKTGWHINQLKMFLEIYKDKNQEIKNGKVLFVVYALRSLLHLFEKFLNNDNIKNYS